MSEHQSIEDVLLGDADPAWTDTCTAICDALADADLPLVDRERGIAVIRLDPELAEVLNRWADQTPKHVLSPNHIAYFVRRAARIIGGESE